MRVGIRRLPPRPMRVIALPPPDRSEVASQRLSSRQTQISHWTMLEKKSKECFVIGLFAFQISLFNDSPLKIYLFQLAGWPPSWPAGSCLNILVIFETPMFLVLMRGKILGNSCKAKYCTWPLQGWYACIFCVGMWLNFGGLGEYIDEHSRQYWLIWKAYERRQRIFSE